MQIYKIWELVDYDCQDGKCLMIWNIDEDSKLGALSPDHRSIGEGIIEELNKLESINRDIKDYVEATEQANTELKRIRDRLEEENSIFKLKNKDLKEQNEYLDKRIDEIKRKYTKTGHEEQIKELTEENQKLNEILKLICGADSVYEEESVKGILKHYIDGIADASEYSSEAFKEYCLLSEFFKEHYGEHWDDD